MAVLADGALELLTARVEGFAHAERGVADHALFVGESEAEVDHEVGGAWLARGGETARRLSFPPRAGETSLHEERASGLRLTWGALRGGW